MVGLVGVFSKVILGIGVVVPEVEIVTNKQKSENPHNGEYFLGSSHLHARPNLRVKSHCLCGTNHSDAVHPIPVVSILLV